MFSQDTQHKLRGNIIYVFEYSTILILFSFIYSYLHSSNVVSLDAQNDTGSTFNYSLTHITSSALFALLLTSWT